MEGYFIRKLFHTGPALAIVDQLIASAGNFLTALLLARGLVPAEFGTFVLINSACLIANGFHANLIVSPLVVLKAAAPLQKGRAYATVALAVTLMLSPVSALVVVCASASLHRGLVGALALAYVLAWQLQETTRRALISSLRYADAIWGDAISYLGQALLVFLLLVQRTLTLDAAFTLMALTSLLAGALQSLQLRLRMTRWDETRAYVREFWEIGKWLLLGAATSITAGPLFPWLLNWFHGREATASYQAAMNLLGLVNPVILSIAAIVMPASATFVAGPRCRSLLELGLRQSATFGAILAPWLLLVLVAPRLALGWFYGRSSIYCTQTTAVRIGVAVYLLTVPLMVFGAILAGSGRSKDNAKMQGIGALVSLFCAPPLIWLASAVGAMLAEIVSRGARVVLSVCMLGNTAASTVPAADVEAGL